MKHIRTIFLTFLTVVLAVTVSACRKPEDSAAETSTEHAAEDVMNFATILHDAKSLKYESSYYTKNLQKFRQTRQYGFAMFGRQGNIIFEPQTLMKAFVGLRNRPIIGIDCFTILLAKGLATPVISMIEGI